MVSNSVMMTEMTPSAFLAQTLRLLTGAITMVFLTLQQFLALSGALMSAMEVSGRMTFLKIFLELLVDAKIIFVEAMKTMTKFFGINSVIMKTDKTAASSNLAPTSRILKSALTLDCLTVEHKTAE
jgi:hypothetical protein